MQFFVISTIEYVILVFAAKVSVALVLFRLASNNKIVRRILVASLVIMLVWTLVSSVIVGLQCQPLSLAWGEGEGTCMDPKILGDVGFAISAMDIVSSFLYAVSDPSTPFLYLLEHCRKWMRTNRTLQALPIFLLQGVQLSPKLKVSVIFLLGMGVV